MGVRMGGPGGPQRIGGGPAGPGAAKGTESAVLRRAASRPPTMWFQSNCPKILLQHEPRAIHSPATNQRQSYRINRFRTRGPGHPGQGRRQGLLPVEGARRGSSSLGPPPYPAGQSRRGQPLRSQPVQASGLARELGSHWGWSQVSRGLPGPGESPACSLHPEHPIVRPRPWGLPHPWNSYALTAVITHRPPKPPRPSSERDSGDSSKLK